MPLKPLVVVVSFLAASAGAGLAVAGERPPSVPLPAIRAELTTAAGSAAATVAEPAPDEPPVQAVAAPAATAAPAPAPAPAAPSGPPRLRPGDSMFWDGGFVRSGAVRHEALCDVAGPCFSFPVLLDGGGHRLRVAIDTPSREDTFQLELLDPSGALVTATSNANQFNAEAFAATPAAGEWTVRVRPVDVTDASFRLRAKSEQAARPAGGRRATLPNLQVVPPYEFGFAAPVTPNGPYPPDRANPPASVAGVDLYSCTPDEAAPVAAGGAGAVDCLRLTSGPTNTGAGPFDMRFTFASDLTDGTADPVELRGPIFQAVHFSDGSVEYRAAGNYIFHTTHAHFHDENILTYELFEVTDERKRTLEPVGSGTKSGFCPADQLFADWFSFDQAVRGDFGEGDTPTGNCFSPTEGLLGLTSGWGDVYRWQRPGQYVEFAGQGDGTYVVRSTVDKANHILEEDESDNASYALVRIVGRSVKVLERGQGTSHWDRRKVVYTGDGPSAVR